MEFRTFGALVAPGDETLEEELNRVWLIASLLAVGDALKEHDYFGHAPLLELVRHLRNGIAHGNRFDIRYPDELKTHPAHNRDADYRSPNGTIFEITPELNGQLVLFEFMGAGDVVDLLASVALHLDKIGRGESS